MKCTQCWLEQAEDGSFCVRCGARLPKSQQSDAAEALRQIEMLLSKANLLRTRKNHRVAISTCQEALKLDPEHPWTHVLLADIYSETGSLEEAVQHLERATALDAGNVNTRRRLETLLQRRKTRGGAAAPPPEAAPPKVAPTLPSEAAELRLAYSLKEKAEKCRAGLEQLRDAEPLAEDEYAMMRGGYEQAANRATSRIEGLKASLQQKHDRAQQTVAAERDRLERLEAEAREGKLLDYQIAAQRSDIQQRLTEAQVELEVIYPLLEAETAAQLGGFVEVNLESGEPDAQFIPLPTPVATPPGAPTILRCRCGASLEAGARFCDQCGQTLA